jgi:hypothetical protein
LIVADAATHVPGHFDSLLSYVLCFFVHLIHDFGNLVRVQD